jgi:C4-dicarboxylate transporter DctQ subunit
VCDKLIEILNYTEDVLLTYCITGVGALIVFDSLLRKFGIFSIHWIEELSRFVLILIAFLGASKAVKDGRHVSMETVVGMLPTQIIHVINAIKNLLCFGFFLFLDYYAWLHIVHLHRIGFRTSTLGIPFFVPYLPIPIFCMGIFVRYFLASLKEFQALLKGRFHTCVTVGDKINESAGTRL